MRSDVEDIARLRAALADSERRYCTLVEHLPVVTYTSAFDADGTLISLSPQVEGLLGRPPAAFLLDDDLWHAHVHPGDVERVIAETARVFHQDEEFDCEYRVVALDGTERVVWERDAIVRDESGSRSTPRA
ncbi:MAG: PAS domain-containing protein [Solirubrobacteraceae bacterium]